MHSPEDGFRSYRICVRQRLPLQDTRLLIDLGGYTNGGEPIQGFHRLRMVEEFLLHGPAEKS